MGTVAFVCEHCGQSVKRFRRPGQRRLCRPCGELAGLAFNSSEQRERRARQALQQRERAQLVKSLPPPTPKPRRRRQAAPKPAPVQQGSGVTLTEALANAVESG